MIRGITVTLISKVEDGCDEFNHPIYTEKTEKVDNVLVTPTEQQQVIDTLNLTGRKAVYTLAIPKGDTHIWEDQTVIIFGERFHVFTPAIGGIDQLIPLDWNKKVMVESYEI